MLFIPPKEIKEIAAFLGFDACGIAKAAPLDEEAAFFRQWIQAQWHADMHYMENHIEKRCNPQVLFKGAKSIISVLLSYKPASPIQQGNYKIAQYAYGKDYHFLVKSKLALLIEELQKQYPSLEALPYCDTAPLFDRAWAHKAGLGWIGKNQCLINEKMGSFCVIGEIVCNAESLYDTPQASRCGDCTRCIDSCPNKALSEKGLNAHQCIAYHTLENKAEKLPAELKTKGYVLGCDQCQNVCPFNQDIQTTSTADYFSMSPFLKELLETSEIENIPKAAFKQLAKGTAFSRIRYEQFLRNIQKAKN